MKSLTVRIGTAGLALCMATSAAAAQIAVQTYSGPNGGGQASGGSFNYWDRNYGTGNQTIDGQPLAGGTGDLTDGYIETQSWHLVENAAGTGPYVGWVSYAQPNPLFTFTFAGTPTINQISLWIDNTGAGGVIAPSAILVNGVSQSFTAPSGVGAIVLSGLNLTGSSHTLQMVHNGGSWIFASEIQFFGAGAVPEPSTWAMLVIGFGAAGAAMRRRRSSHTVVDTQRSGFRQ